MEKIIFPMLENYIKQIKDFDDSTKLFIVRQIKRMPDHYYTGVYILCSIFYFLRIHPNKVHLLHKLIFSLSIIKSFED